MHSLSKSITLLISSLFSLSVTYANTLKIQQIDEQKQLIKLNLNDLLSLQTTSVSKKKQTVSKSAAAIFIITHQDIKRSGVRNIPEALRMAPGINVAKIDGNKWAVTARGFNGLYANKLLVLIDGRSIYTPFFSGVEWSEKNVLLEDIDRIEIIRGSSAALWGANAVNGVINIISKTADKTQGTYAMIGGGSKERGFVGIRYGGKLKDNINYRVYAKYIETDHNIGLNQQPINDDMNLGQGGFRLDWETSSSENLTVQGDIYENTAGHTLIQAEQRDPINTTKNIDAKSTGGNILFRWNKQYRASDSTSLQLYYDYTEKDSSWLRKEHSTLDFYFQHNLAIGTQQKLIWGAGYRFVSDDIEGSYLISTQQSNIDTHLLNFFIQDEIELIKDQLTFTFGSKFEHNDFSGFEVQPNANLIWTPNNNHSVWTSISRAVRTPSRSEQGGQINQPFKYDVAPLPLLITARANPQNQAEDILSFQLGYRLKPIKNISIDSTIFYTKYNHLRNFQINNSPVLNQNMENSQPFLQQFIDTNNNMNGESYGAELVVSWQARENLHLSANYSYLQLQLHTTKQNILNLSENEEDESPHHQFSIRSSLNISHNIEWDLWLRYIDNIPEHQIPSYITMDTRLAWQPFKAWQISIVGQNLLDSYHPEFKNSLISVQSTQVARSIYGKLEWRF